jgi:hypothetical protein
MLKQVTVGGNKVRTRGGGVMADGLNGSAAMLVLAVEVWSGVTPSPEAEDEELRRVLWPLPHSVLGIAPQGAARSTMSAGRRG